MDSSDQDYLTDYRIFFDSIYQSFNLADDPLPVHIGKYNVAEFEIVGEIICWCLEYLNIRKCPSSLLAPLCRSVIGEMEDEIRKDPEGCGYRPKEDDYQTLKLMQVTISKLVEVCLRYKDNSELSRLPPPPPVPPSVSAAAVKNGRRTMEDAHIIIHDLHSLFGIQGYGVASYYAVFDGHIGSDAALYSCSHVYQYLMESPFYPSNPEAAFKEAFIKTDERFIDKSNKENLKSGTTAVSVLIRHDLGKLYVAWLGDSQAILVNGRKYIQLVNPHRPEQAEERERIENLGGSVVYWGTWRVNGQLAVSRAIGDVDYKPYVTADADVCSYDLSGDEDFLLLACDGLWDVLSEKDAVEEVYKCLEQNKGDRSRVSASLVQAAKSLGSKDNISVVVAWLDMSTLENGHFPEAHDVLDTPEDIHLPPVLRSIKPPVQTLPSAPQRLDEDAEKWLMTLPWSYADVLKKPAPKKEEPPAPAVAPPPPKEERPDVCQEVSESSGREVPDVCQKAPEAPTKGEEAGADVGVESGEDSDEEWNYVSGKENRTNNQHNKQELSEEDMESQLNPNAAEFVPIGTLNDDISHSPTKRSELRSLEKVRIPSAKEFLNDIAKRPSEIDEFGENNDKTLNGDLNNISTKAVFGDDSECFNATIDSSLLQNESLKSTNPFAPSQVPNFVQDHFSEELEFKPLNESQVEAFDLLCGKGGEQASPLLRESPEPGLHNGQLGSPSPNQAASPSPVPDQGPETCVDSESEEDAVINSQEKEENLEFEEKFTQRLVDEAFKAGPAVLEDSLCFLPKEPQNELLSEVLGNSQKELIDHSSTTFEGSLVECEEMDILNDGHSNTLNEVKNPEQDVVCLSLEATPMNAEQVVLDQSPIEEVCSKREVHEELIVQVKESPLTDDFVNLAEVGVEETPLRKTEEEITIDEEEKIEVKENESFTKIDEKMTESLLGDWTTLEVEKQAVGEMEEKVVNELKEKAEGELEENIVSDLEEKVAEVEDAVTKAVDENVPFVADEQDEIEVEEKIFNNVAQKLSNEMEEMASQVMKDKVSNEVNENILSELEEKIVSELKETVECELEEKVLIEDKTEERITVNGTSTPPPEKDELFSAAGGLPSLSFEAVPMNVEQVVLDQSPIEEVCSKREVHEELIAPVKETRHNDEYVNQVEVEETLLSKVEEGITTDEEDKVEVKKNESFMTKMEEEKIESLLGERTFPEMEKHVLTELEEVGTSEIEKKVVNELQEKTASELEEKIVSDLEEQVPEVEEKVTIAVDEKVPIAADEKVEIEIERKESHEVKEMVFNEVEKASHEMEEKVSNEVNENTHRELEEKIVSELKEKVESEFEEKAVSEDKTEEKITVNGTSTPPTEKDELATAAVAAGVATALVGGAATIAVSEAKADEKKKPASPKKPEAAGKVSAKPAPAKPAAAKSSTTSKAPAATKAPLGKTAAAAKPSSPGTKTASPRPPSATTKPATPTSKPSTPTTKTATTKPLTKPSTATTAKAPVASAALKSKPAVSSSAKPAAAKPDAAKPTAAKPTTTTTARPGAATTSKPSAAAPKKPLTPTSSTAKPAVATAKPAVATAKPAASKPAPATKTAITKTPATSTSKPPTPSSRPSSATTKPPLSSASKVSAKPSAPPAKPPAAKPATTKPAGTTVTSSTASKAPATKPAATKAPAKPTPAAPLNKKPAAPTTIKKPSAPTDKSVKEANNKLASAKIAAKKVDEKKIISKKEEIIDNFEPLTQEPIISTTNGHISLIENGIPTPEIVAEVI